MEDAIAEEPVFHRCNSNFSKNGPEIQGKIRVAQLTFNPVKTVHKIIR